MTKVFLGGTLYPEVCLPPSPHGRFDWWCLTSFYDAGSKWCKFYMEHNKLFNGYIMDSGAFSLLGSQKHKTNGVNWDEYVERYAACVNKYDVDNFIELDLDAIIGLPEVERLRAKLEHLTNKQCMPVWHKSRGWDYWERMISKYKYVCIGGIAAWDIKPNEVGIFRHLLRASNEAGCKVHGLGFTNTQKLARYPFYSVDSSSWNGGWKWGRLPRFAGGKIITIEKPAGRRLKTSNGEWRPVVEYSFREWLKYCYYMDDEEADNRK